MDKTRENIMTAATRLFSEKGLSGVTVREICREAGVNGALVNYHFRNKEGLYRECVEAAYRGGRGDFLRHLADGVKDARSWKAAVRAWVTEFAASLHARGPSAIGFLRQEVTHPSKMQPYLEETYGRPLFESLRELVGMAVGSEREVCLWTASVWSQLMAYALVDPAWQKFFRPADAEASRWGSEFAGFVCERVFEGLRYRRRR